MKKEWIGNNMAFFSIKELVNGFYDYLVVGSLH